MLGWLTSALFPAQEGTTTTRVFSPPHLFVFLVVQLAKGPCKAYTVQNNACIICPVLSPLGDKFDVGAVRLIYQERRLRWEQLSNVKRQFRKNRAGTQQFH